ncbi:hypothetical protein NMY22_g210 [Coprinellus aureogranulatus]|nr:hypothetical protein NMY22_g210 [Coprinellus aureogranulatus]
MSSPVPIPLELILLVLSHLDKEKDRNVLRNFSQTSSTFRDLCQSLLFHHIVLATSELGNSQALTPGERFLDLLSSSPRLIPHVKRITISDYATERSSTWVSWPVDDLKLAEALDKLNLKAIEYFELKRYSEASWGLLKQPVRRAIVEICRSPALLELSLHWAPLVLLCACGPSLKHFSGYDCRVADSATDIAPTPRSSDIYLETLQIHNSFNMDGSVTFFLETSNRIRLDKLRKAQVTASTFDDDSDPPLPKLLACCQGSLEVLAFVFVGHNILTELKSGPSLRFPRLAMLHFVVDVTTPIYDTMRFALSAAVDTLWCILQADNSSIRTIRLVLNFNLSEISDGLAGESMNDPKTALNDIGFHITRLEGCPRLKAIEIAIHSSNPEEDDAESIREWVLAALNIPLANRLLSVVSSPRKSIRSKLIITAHQPFRS